MNTLRRYMQNYAVIFVYPMCHFQRKDITNTSKHSVLDRIQIDLTQIAFEKEDILARKGFFWVLTVIDCFSKFAWAYPLKTKETKPICEILCKLFLTEGIPLILQSDNGGEFVSNIIKHIMPNLGIKLINGSPYTPTTQGQVERFNKTFKSRFKKEIQINLSADNTSRVENWSEELLPGIISTHIHGKHRSLSRSPWEVYYARPAPHPTYSTTQLESLNPIDIELCSCPDDKTIGSINQNSLMDDMRVRAEVNEKIVIQTLNQTRKIQVENYRRICKGHNPNHSITVGMTAYLKNPKTTRKFNRKNLHGPTNVKVNFLKKTLLLTSVMLNTKT